MDSAAEEVVVAAIDRRSCILAVVLLGACTPDGGVQFVAPPPSSSGFETGETAGEGTSGGGSGGLPPPSTTLPPATSNSTSDETTGDTGEAPASGTLVPARAGQWRYLASASPPATDWASPTFADGDWIEGAAPIGDEGDVATVIDPAAAPVGVYLRRHFTATPGASHLMLYLRRGDGAAVYLNGAELVRSNLPAGALAPTTLAEDNLGGNEVLRYMRFVVPADALLPGDNVVAVALRRAVQGEPGLGFDLQLDAFMLTEAPSNELRAQWRTRSYGGEYARENVGAAWIETAGGVFVRTLIVWAEVRREHLVRWQSSADGNVVDAMTSATRGGHRTSEVAWDLRDAQGQALVAGDYKLMLEFTEDNSNKGDPPGPRLELPFMLGAGPSLPTAPAHPHYRDLLVVAP